MWPASVEGAPKQKGFKFVGPTLVPAWMQAVGIVHDHSACCFRRQQVTHAGSIRERVEGGVNGTAVAEERRVALVVQRRRRARAGHCAASSVQFPASA
ncbi:DNA-3-methyladenine glycosylase I [Burkholderia metallica]|uniref:DNA-3-methyladenine glycosylase I n=1 Tax=Burkholderia metallica TaxID=488729 RepID=UPI00157B537F|nr:DNA-3-methyladenine glycosylase I [Burkholderia metallica]NTZ87589.1 DNA-3-methyladenine glycosylase I [Burkholderia metallica]